MPKTEGPAWVASIEIYTDGACRGNPGPGGWAFVVLDEGKILREHAGGEAHTTNNRMEMQAVIEGLSALDFVSMTKEERHIRVFSDSQYVVKGASEWIFGWKRNKWQTRTGPVKNRDLWDQIDGFMMLYGIDWRWVRGHNGHPMNERCDRLAVAAIGMTP